MVATVTLIGSVLSGLALACAWLVTMLLPRQPIGRLPFRILVGWLAAISVYYLWTIVSDVFGFIHRSDAFQSFNTLLLALVVIAIVAPRVWEAQRRH
ncbi:MAG TPA: hypothetical protein VFD32_13680 [Dehalococcoidia bacterium]|nr:hypothetical protein [Dehalococcoidia bacterium]